MLRVFYRTPTGSADRLDVSGNLRPEPFVVADGAVIVEIASDRCILAQYGLYHFRHFCFLAYTFLLFCARHFISVMPPTAPWAPKASYSALRLRHGSRRHRHHCSRHRRRRRRRRRRACQAGASRHDDRRRYLHSSKDSRRCHGSGSWRRYRSMPHSHRRLHPRPCDVGQWRRSRQN